jgi:hypothetical protein
MNNDRRDRNERRKERYSYKQNILVDGVQLFRSIDISEGGLYVYTGRSYMQNSVVNVTLPLKNSKLTVKARVKHNQRGVGMGLMFINLLPKPRAMIKELVTELANKAKDFMPQKKKILLAEKK